MNTMQLSGEARESRYQSGSIALIAGLTLFKLLLHFFTNTNYEFHRDEFLYLALGYHLDWGYFSVPPGIALVGNLVRTLFGDSLFAVRLFPALIGAASIVVISMTVLALGGRRWALLLANAAFILSPAFLRSNTLFQPVSFDQFCWLLSAFFMVKLLQSKNPVYWIYIGLLWGIAFLNKYAIAIFAAGMILGILLTPQRSLLLNRQAIVGAILGLLVISPNLYWQYSNDWPVIIHYQLLQQYQFSNVTTAGFLLMQILMNYHAVILWVPGLLFLLFMKDGKAYRALGIGVLAVTAIFLVMRGKPYYTLGVYSFLFAVGGVALERYTTERRQWVKPAFLVLMILLSIAIIPFSLPLLPLDKMIAYGEWASKRGVAAALVWEDGQMHELPQDYADMTGWKELADVTINAYNMLTEAEKQRAAIYAENYGMAGAIWHYGKKQGLPEPVSFSDAYLFWAPDSADLDVFIYVNTELGEDVQTLFADITLAGQLSDPHARESGTQVYICRQPDREFARFYANLVQDLRSNYRRDSGEAAAADLPPGH